MSSEINAMHMQDGIPHLVGQYQTNSATNLHIYIPAIYVVAAIFSVVITPLIYQHGFRLCCAKAIYKGGNYVKVEQGTMYKYMSANIKGVHLLVF